MASVAELRVRPEDLSFRVLQADPQRVGPDQAAGAVRQFLRRKRAGLAQAVKVSADPHAVILRAEGEMPAQLIEEARELLGLGQDLTPGDEIEVDAAEFTIEVVPQTLKEPEFEREVLRSRVRYFPYPECEWFSISTGMCSTSPSGSS
jgi:xanthine/CO dehydrogenase XdhC/CoxF family maturation factor